MYRFVKRAYKTKNVTVPDAGHVGERSTVFAFDGGWNTANPGATIIVPNQGDKKTA